ncbi:lytic murein transglycosylase [Maribius pontilimi]|uniref:Lytic murein transglycosylase n=1 Tax=Palleronia pontilimi TaxID=1964209 RepID=A0A934MDA4_9RHOB|nr:lytic murein transglycosylase [Palleronia pontilimi]MBJ3763320.1 lytic murein transglycosylase [Palleronia pontilimi]
MRRMTMALMSMTLGGAAFGQEDTVRPAPRIDATPPTAAAAPDAEARAEPEDIQRPQTRPADLNDAQAKAEAARDAAFRDWLAAFRGRALTQGVSSATFDAAMTDVSYLSDVIDRDRNQAEFTMPIWTYLDRAVSDARVEAGQAALAKQARLLEAIETRYGVEKEIVAAVWGMESAYGTRRGDLPVMSSLATLAHDGRRGRFFEAQLVAALQILQAGDVTAPDMLGSWAGAMGHTQFIPTSFIAYAVDFTGDGKRDIWGDNPADALASTAAYLSGFGWVTGQPWGVEVQLPDDFDYALAARSVKKLPSDWAGLGVTAVSGEPVDDYGEASILLPAGAAGVAFMTFPNFAVIERYNAADAYVIGVGHLADRIGGGDPFQAEWPRDERALSFDERVELQELLTAAGFNTRGADGKIGPNSITAIRGFQRARGLSPDGYASLSLLNTLRDRSG